MDDALKCMEISTDLEKGCAVGPETQRSRVANEVESRESRVEGELGNAVANILLGMLERLRLSRLYAVETNAHPHPGPLPLGEGGLFPALE